MNITLSADQEVIAKSRQYAKAHNTTLNNMIREFLKDISGECDNLANSDEFVRIAKTMSGRSDSTFKFDREEIHDRS
jgi:predicted house-cleaning NTP pyrophosphatase (Maf/HAM1 superfamily)